LVARNDAHLPVAEDIRKPGVGLLQVKADGVLVDYLDALDDVEVDPRRRASRLVHYALDGDLDIVGLDLSAVMEFDAGSQVKRPGLLVLARAPALGKVRLHLAASIDLGEARKNEEVDDVLLADLGLGGSEG